MKRIENKIKKYCVLQPHHKEVFSECDEDQNGVIIKAEMKNHITRVRDRMGVNYTPTPSTPLR